MRSSWAARFLLPLAQVVAEGSWLAVSYAALQALAGAAAWLGPLELAAVAWAGMAWGRRRRWRSAAVEALGLPVLALVAGGLGWVIDPEVRQALLRGDLLAALALHGPGWIAAVAFWRGEVHRSAEDDDAIQERLLRWAVPGLAIPWVAGHLATDGLLEREFTAAAFMGTTFFVASAFTAMGLARLEAVRASTGSDWRANRSWVAVVMGVAILVTVAAIPIAALMDIPARSLMVALLGPLQALLFALLLLATPIVVLAAAVADAIAPLIPEGFNIAEIQLPDLGVDTREMVSSAPVIIFYLVVGLIVLIEAVILAFVLWVRWQERRRMRLASLDAFEERSIVVPPREEGAAREPSSASRPRRRVRGEGPVAAYLQALTELERDGRWARHPHESPAAHAGRVRGAIGAPSLGRLAAAYQLVRYGGLRLTRAEAGRAGPRLRVLRARLRR